MPASEIGRAALAHALPIRRASRVLLGTLSRRRTPCSPSRRRESRRNGARQVVDAEEERARAGTRLPLRPRVRAAAKRHRRRLFIANHGASTATNCDHPLRGAGSTPQPKSNGAVDPPDKAAKPRGLAEKWINQSTLRSRSAEGPAPLEVSRCVEAKRARKRSSPPALTMGPAPGADFTRVGYRRSERSGHGTAGHGHGERLVCARWADRSQLASRRPSPSPISASRLGRCSLDRAWRREPWPWPIGPCPDLGSSYTRLQTALSSSHRPITRARLRERRDGSPALAYTDLRRVQFPLCTVVWLQNFPEIHREARRRGGRA